MMFFLAYVIVYLWFWRYHVGYLLDDIRSPYLELDGLDMAMCFFFGSMCCIAWPLTASGRAIYVLSKKYGPTDAALAFFPAPSKIETKEQKRNRIDCEQKQQIAEMQQTIARMERENRVGEFKELG